MTFHELSAAILALSDRDYLLLPSGVSGRYHLGEQGMGELHLINATPEDILTFIQNSP